VRTRTLVALPVAAAAVALLAGCVFSPGVNTAPTVPAEDIATLAADALEEQEGIRSTIDCGDEDIPVKAGTSVTCVLVDSVAGLEFDVVITFTEVSGSDYTIGIRRADVPNNAPQPTAEPGASVPVTEIEALAIRALTPSLGFVPVVVCDATEVEIVVGTTVDCSYESPTGTVDAVVTITAFDANTGTYTIRVD